MINKITGLRKHQMTKHLGLGNRLYFGHYLCVLCFSPVYQYPGGTHTSRYPQRAIGITLWNDTKRGVSANSALFSF